MEIDDLDRKIIEALKNNGRASNAEIARHLDVTEGTVRSRIKRLTDTGILRVTGQVDPEVLTNCQVVLIGINVKESRSLEKTVQAIAKLPSVTFAAITSGRYDIIAQVVVHSRDGIIDFLSNSLARIPAVNRTETFLLLKTHGCWI
jgi:Lrp/AsnC family transcriptional regulator for asnA, asnC and gidA